MSATHADTSAFDSTKGIEENATVIPVKQRKNLPPHVRRPTTRSQTGTIAKRRTRDDVLDAEPRKRVKSTRSTQNNNSDLPLMLESGSYHRSHTTRSPSPKLSSASSSSKTRSEASFCSTSSTPALPSSTSHKVQSNYFNHSSTVSETDQPQNRLPRSRASLPTPIPNLTKRSRGRRVPTKDTADNNSSQRDDRLYVCSVEGCGKCFHRGEHLKRHIRSIHTHEKPFKCTFHLCEKYFNRHDNLLQHLKVHRQANSLPGVSSPSASALSLEEEESLEGPPVSGKRRRVSQRQQRSLSEAEELEEEEEDGEGEEEDEDDLGESPVASLPVIRPRTIYDAYPPRYSTTTTTTSTVPLFNQTKESENFENAPTDKIMTRMTSLLNVDKVSSELNEPMNISTNVAVSSLRTELPTTSSQVDMRSNIGIVGAV